jgi:hypothetical protein
MNIFEGYIKEQANIEVRDYFHAFPLCYIGFSQLLRKTMEAKDNSSLRKVLQMIVMGMMIYP